MKKLDVTYIYSVCDEMNFQQGQKRLFFSQVTSIMTDILDNQSELNIKYSDITILYILSYNRFLKDNNVINEKEFLIKFCKEMLSRIDTEYVLMTFGSFIDVTFAIELLKKGKKVIAGGAITKLYNLNTLRDIIKFNGGENLDNLLVIAPYINKKFNIYKAIKEWKDIDINTIFDLSELNITTSDFFTQYSPILRKHKINFGSYVITLNGNCKWNNCSFCQKPTLEVPKQFISMKTIEKTLESFLYQMKSFNIREVLCWDPCFQLSEENIYFLKFLRKHNFKISIYNNVRTMKNEKYFNTLFYEFGDIINTIQLGVETLDDFALKLLNTGSTVQDCFDIANTLVNKTNVNINHLFIENLAYKNIEGIKNNHRNINLLSQIYDKKFSYSMRKFRAYPLVEYVNNPFMRLKNHPYTFINEYDRIDENGKIIVGTDNEISGNNFIST